MIMTALFCQSVSIHIDPIRWWMEGGTEWRRSRKGEGEGKWEQSGKDVRQGGWQSHMEP